MKKLLYPIASMLAVAATATMSASAADIFRSEGGYKDTTVYVPVPTWTGFYFGVNGGYGWSANSNQFSFPAVGIEPAFGGVNPAGGFGGGQIGYNWQMPSSHLVLGIEADIQGSGIGDSRSLAFFFEELPISTTAKSSLDWFGTVRGRVGYAFDTSLVYFTGGFAFGGINNRISGVVEIPFLFSKEKTATGYTLGGGYEYKFSPAWSLKAEYQYINLGKHKPESADPLFILGGDVKINDDAFHAFRLGLNYHIQPSYEPLK